MNIELAQRMRLGRKLVFTNGVFDILHPGHVKLLQEARSLGDLLIVGVNSDASVRRLGKGPERPINHESDRMAVLEALRAVDAAVIFPEDTPIELIKVLEPEIHVKGGDYTAENLPEFPVVSRYGGKVVIIPLVDGHSTTNIVRRLKT